MDKIHPRVDKKLDQWQQSWYSKWFYFEEEYDPANDKSIEKDLLETVYDENWKKNHIDIWSKEEYEKFREKLIRRVFPTIYFPELVNRLSEWNLFFSLKN